MENQSEERARAREEVVERLLDFMDAVIAYERGKVNGVRVVEASVPVFEAVGRYGDVREKEAECPRMH